tara:strand:+ start:154 stop:639 length:486 start_codon:yes stop_codon:yes gene_type:complete
MPKKEYFAQSLTDVWGSQIGGGSEIIDCADVNSARGIIGLGSDPNCLVDNFTERPHNFPQSKVDKFSQDWQALLDKFDEELSGVGSGIPVYGSGRDIILNEILAAVKTGDYRGVKLIKNMSSTLYDAAQRIDDNVTTLAGIKQQFNALNNEAVNTIRDKLS